MPCNKYNFNKSNFCIKMGGKQWVIMYILDTIRLYLANKTNCNWASVLEVINNNNIVLLLAVIIKSAWIIY